MKIRNRSYSVGTLAKFYGISTDTIRLYDKKGVLLSQKNDANQYRIYERDDILTLDYILKLRDMDIPLTEIRNIMGEMDLKQICDYTESRMEALEQEIERLQEIKQKTAAFSSDMHRLFKGLGKMQLLESPLFVLKDISDGIDEAHHFFDQWGIDGQNYLAIYSKGDMFRAESLENIRHAASRPETAEYYICREDTAAVSLQKNFPTEQCIILPPRPCIHCIFEAFPLEQYDWPYDIWNFAKAHNFRLSSDTLIYSLLTKSKGEYCAEYYESWCPVEAI